MRGPSHDSFPSWRYGPDGKSAVFESEADVPAGWEDHPSKLAGAADMSDSGTKTAVESPNGGTTAEEAAKTTAPVSQTQVDPAVSAQSGVGGVGNSPPSGNGTANAATDTETPGDLDSDGHPYNEALHATTKSKTKDGRWRMKVGKTRPAPAPGYPKVAQPLDL
jgi:hypothetical protein